MITTIKAIGLIRGLMLSMFIAGPMYVYHRFLSSEWKPMSMEDSDRFHDRWIPDEVFESEQPDMGAETKTAECESSWGSFEADHILRRPTNSTALDDPDGKAIRCDKWKNDVNGPYVYGWTYVDDKP